MRLREQLEAAIVKLLAESGGTGRALSKEYGVHQVDISALRRGKASKIYSTDKLESLAAAFGIGYTSELVKVDRVSPIKAAVGPVVLEDLTGVF